MSARQPFLTALTALASASGPSDDLCGPFLLALPIRGAALSTLGDPLGSATVCSSDPRAAELDEIQLDLGEGPCWDALATDSPILLSDIQTSADDRWTFASPALRETGLEAVFAFPLRYGRLGLGAVDLYSDDPVPLSDDDVADAATLAGVAARQVLQRALQRLDAVGQGAEAEGEDAVDGFARREIHQATGMVSAQLDISVQDALLVLRGHAYATSATLREVAADVVARRLDLGD